MLKEQLITPWRDSERGHNLGIHFRPTSIVIEEYTLVLSTNANDFPPLHISEHWTHTLAEHDRHISNDDQYND